MTFKQATRHRLFIALKCAGIIFTHKSLVIFPCISMSFACTVLGFFYFTVGPDKMQLMLNTLRNEQGVQTINVSYYGALAVALYLVVALATAMNFALINCISIGLDGKNARILEGLTAAGRRLPAVFAWSILSITLGALWTLFDQERRSSVFLRRRFGNTWNNMSMLAVPITVLENQNIVTAVLRSRMLLQDTWGRNVSASFGTIWFLVILNFPLLIKYIFLRMSGMGITLPFAEFALLYIACTLILTQTAKAVFKVVLYRFAAKGVASGGFDRETLECAFQRAESA